MGMTITDSIVNYLKGKVGCVDCVNESCHTHDKIDNCGCGHDHEHKSHDNTKNVIPSPEKKDTLAHIKMKIAYGIVACFNIVIFVLPVLGNLIGGWFQQDSGMSSSHVQHTAMEPQSFGSFGGGCAGGCCTGTGGCCVGGMCY